MNRYKLIKVAVASLTIAGGGAVILTNIVGRNADTTALLAQEIRFEPHTKWDFNWDKREPSALIKPRIEKNSKEYEELLEKNSSKATRHLLLIRHGQYKLKETEADKKVLTDLGIFS